MANYNLNAILSVTNRFTQPLNQFRQQMSNIQQTTRQAQSTINNSMNNTTHSIGSTRSQVMQLGNQYRAMGQSASEGMRQAWQQVRNTQQATQQASRSMRDFTSNSSGLDGIVNKFKNLALSIGAIVGINKLVELSDNMSNLDARLGLMNDGLQTTEELQNMIFEASERSRGSYTETANMVAKLGINAKDAFSSSQEIVGFSENMNKLFKMGGASAEEQKAGMLQLTQALSSGRLQGDEFRSITENAPELIGILAEKLGKTRAELRQMSTDGELTSDVIIKAVMDSTDKINDQFGKIPKTWSDIWKHIKNTALKASIPILNSINWIANNVDFTPMTEAIKGAFQYLKDSGAIETFKNAIKGAFDFINNTVIPKVKELAPLLQKFKPIIAGVVSAFVSFKLITNTINTVKNVIGGLSSAFTFLTSPIGLVVVGIGLLVAGFIYAYKHSETFREKVNSAWEFIKNKTMELASKVSECISVISQWLDNHREQVEAFKQIVSNIVVSIVETIWDLISDVGSIFGGIIDVIMGVIDVITGIFEGDWNKVWEGMKEIVSGAIESIESWWQSMIDLITAPIDLVVNLFKNDQSSSETLTNGTDSREVKEVGENAKGTNNWRGGWTWVNEEGGELMNLPNGTQIIPHDLSETMVKEQARNVGNGMSVNIPKLADTIVVREDADIDKIGEALANKLNVARMKFA